MQIIKNRILIAIFLNLGVIRAMAGTDNLNNASPIQWRIEYDQDGLVAKLIDPGGKATKLQYAFDEQKQLRKVTRELADGTSVVADFDERGRRVLMTDALGVVRYDYDELNRLIGVGREGQPKITYDYDTLDRLTSVGVGEDFKTRYIFDFLDRLAAIDSPAGKITYNYQTGQNKVIRTLPNGVWTVWERGPDGKLVSLTHVTKDHKVILKFEYAYRPDGLIEGIKEWSPQVQKTVAYEYDQVQRLVTVNDSRAGATRYTYDPLGNRTQVVNPDGRAINSAYD